MRRLAVFVALSLSAAAFGASTALAAKPIKPKQAFEAFANGSPAGAVIQVACAGPATTGHPLAGQYLKVKHEKVIPNYVPGPFGFTGDGTAIVAYAQSATPTSTSALGIVLARFDHYGRLPLPTTASFPCEGSGVIAFVPVDGGTSGYTATVKVTFASPPSTVPEPATH